MPEELTSLQVTTLRERLDELEAELKTQLGDLIEEVRPVDLDQPIGRLSRMDAMQQQKMAEASRRQIRLRYDRVLASISAMNRDEYGLCLRCEEPIGYKRLSARPESALCLECQSAKEKRQ